MDLGGGFVDPAHHVEVVLERQLVVQAADDVQLGCPAGTGLPCPLDDLVAVHHVGPVFAQVSAERTEVARVYADVGRVDVRVDVVVRKVTVVPLAYQVGHRAQRKQVVRRLERQPVVEAQPLAGLDFIANRLQSVCCARHRQSILSPARWSNRNPTGSASLFSDILVAIETIINWTRFRTCTAGRGRRYRTPRSAQQGVGPFGVVGLERRPLCCVAQCRSTSCLATSLRPQSRWPSRPRRTTRSRGARRLVGRMCHFWKSASTTPRTTAGRCLSR